MFRVDNKDSKILIQKALSTMFILIQLVLLFMIHGIMVMIIGMVDQKNKLLYFLSRTLSEVLPLAELRHADSRNWI